MAAQENTPGQEPEAGQLPPVRTSITVVETIEAESPANLTVATGEDLRQTPGVNLDERLGVVPGFTLFRRFTSTVSHPTAQGVSLRGIGPSGASRTLVRWDGVPVNDPFGGWVQWTRFSPEEIDRVEIVRGAVTSAFGDRAMGGAISIFSRPLDRTRGRASYEFGNRDTHEAGGGFAWLGQRLAASASARGFTTDGYYVVPENERGIVDTEANVRFVAGDTRLDLIGGSNRFFTKFDFLTEDRGNGTIAQRNSTSLGTIAGHFVRETSGNGFSALAYHTREEFRNVFSSVSADHNSETPTTRQQSPAEAVGGGGMWRHSSQGGWTSLVGGDFQRVEGVSNDVVVASGFRRSAGGTQLQHGYFGQLDLEAGPARFFAGARYHFAGADRRFFSPNAGVVAGRGIMRFRGSVYRAFRVPTLNELYRPFRVGNVNTLPNADLGPESMTGGEVGVDLTGETRRLGITGYRNKLKDLVTNVTLSSTPNLITRERRNGDEAVTQGVEVEMQQRWRNFSGQLAYLFTNSAFETGLRVPQVARHQGSAQVSYNKRGTLVAMGLRAYSSQFEDDLNEFLLPGFSVLHLRVIRDLRGGVAAMASFENLLNREFIVGYTPSARIGNPRLWRVGLRWNIQR